MKTALVPCSLFGLLLAVSCAGGDAIVVTITPSASAAINDGQTPTQVVALVNASGATAPDGTQVTFTIDSKTSASFTSFAPGQAATQSITVSTSAGNATATVYDVADESVTISISAEITPDSGDNYSIDATASITFGGKCKDSFISAQPTSLQSGVPASITLSCESDYMGGIFPFDEATNQLFTGNTQPCFATVNDASEQSIANAAVQFLTEAGTFETDVQATGQHPTELTDSTGVAHVNYHVSAPYPEDVDWSTSDGMLNVGASGTSTVKRQWTGTDAEGNPHTYNPRDGWVTMIAAVPGIPSSATTGPCTSTSCPEPFVDRNDNNTWDLGEPYIDVNCDGTWNDQQDPNTEGLLDVWTSKTIVWTDGVWNASSCSGTGCTGSGPLGDNPANCSKDVTVATQTGSSCAFVFRWVDKNLNLLSTFLTSADNQISYDVVMGDIVTPQTQLLNQALIAKALVQSPDFSVPLVDSAVASDPIVTLDYNLTAAGTFVFGDNSVGANATLVLEQTFSYGLNGTCDSN